ncbi:hypothetical protein CEXT_133721 [Caerostris extrusa]|uniref:Uncharacterized protein n=1 Tax=Caerostris extrusa TaxID=172846 RepID=A0AAV4SF26_CAEEX|nr:hypothetical protein CEXT_133721 [Caerostris extrusa]
MYKESCQKYCQNHWVRSLLMLVFEFTLVLLISSLLFGSCPRQWSPSGSSFQYILNHDYCFHPRKQILFSPQDHFALGLGFLVLTQTVSVVCIIFLLTGLTFSLLSEILLLRPLILNNWPSLETTSRPSLVLGENISLFPLTARRSTVLLSSPLTLDRFRHEVFKEHDHEKRCARAEEMHLTSFRQTAHFCEVTTKTYTISSVLA